MVCYKSDVVNSAVEMWMLCYKSDVVNSMMGI